MISLPIFRIWTAQVWILSLESGGDGVHVTYKVGDLVTVRGWDDMLQEFSSGFAGAINPPSGVPFISTMRATCGHTYRISGIERVTFAGSFHLTPYSEGAPCTGACFTHEMLIPYEEEAFSEVDPSRLDFLLG